MIMSPDMQQGRSLLKLFDLLFDQAPLMVDGFDKEGRCILWNQECVRVFGWSAEEIKAHPHPLALFYPEEEQYKDVLEGIASADGEMFREWYPSTRDGKQLTTMWANIPLPSGDMLCIGHDLTELRRAENQQRLAASVFASSYAGIIITDADNRICDVNPAFTRLTGYSRTEVIGQSPLMLDSGSHSRSHYTRIWRHLIKHGGWRGELWGRRRNGEIYPQHLSMSLVRDAREQVLNCTIIFSDITELKRHENELKYQATHDALTRLPNRQYFSQHLERALDRARRHNGLLAVCYLDLDGFKPINDRFGHAAGDDVLVAITRRLQGVIRDSDLLARLGGDEFAVLLADLHDHGECLQAVQRMQQTLTQPIAIGECLACITVSIGITLYPQDNANADTLLRHADQAMYRAKNSGKNRYQLFDPSLGLPERRHQQRVEAALANDELTLHYQPRIDLASGDLLGFEALLRWPQPPHGLVMPVDILPMVQDPQLVSSLGEWVIERVLRQLRQWQQLGVSPRVSFNISLQHLSQPDFGERLEGILSRYPELSPTRLELEFRCEDSADGAAPVANSLAHCRTLGLSLAMDNFGAGHSSLAQLLELPIDTLKIDRCFIKGLLSDERNVVVVEGVMQIARRLGLTVVAEGAESPAHCRRLQQLGCYRAQGYGIAAPMPAERALQWMQQYQSPG
ncbi:hypothetical protein HCU01_03950 [Halomonas cupida]|uniref:PAS domain S-box-containing protein/diguanylate cyclase (GGDEF) domain-containing protein n=2 Tax=Halomonas cupida TaxID=44933 RepID=A0A1M7AC35_9GAMM|nr:hypothetical protein HCU01_03950 [Halomonas cupida]SHL40240.1 PAS domain S-box-containing protein/diguanylate cyclase (GGDEF) domain-containing protein [Halomonas cupida]